MTVTGQNGSDGFILPAALLVFLVLAVSATAIQTSLFLEKKKTASVGDAIQDRWFSSAALHTGLFLILNEPGYFASDKWRKGVELNIRYRNAEVKIFCADTFYNVNGMSGADMVKSLQALGINHDVAVKISDTLLDWRDPDSLERLNGEEKGRQVSPSGNAVYPGNRNLLTVSEVSQISSISSEDREKIKRNFVAFQGVGKNTLLDKNERCWSDVNSGQVLRVFVEFDVEGKIEEKVVYSVMMLGSGDRGYYLMEAF